MAIRTMKLRLVAFVVALAGCTFLSDVDDLDATTPLLGYRVGGTNQGAVLAAYSTESLASGLASRIVFAGGPGSAHYVFGVWSGASVDLRRILDGCEDGTCGPATGVAVTGLSNVDTTIDGGRRFSYTDCVLVGSAPPPGNPMDTGVLRVQCEGEPSSTVTVDGPDGVRFGTEVAGLPAALEDLGVALVGAPGDARIRVLGADLNPRSLEQPMDANLGTESRLGVRFAVAREPQTVPGLRGDAAVFLAAAPGSARPEDGRVVAFGFGRGELDDALTLVTLGCLAGVRVRAAAAPPDDGGSFALGDLGPSAGLDVVIGDPMAGTVRRWSLSSFTGAAGCAATDTSDDPAPADMLTCPPPMGDVSCSSFGGSVAVGNFDGQGGGDLLVGAPSSTVEGEPGAGAAYVFAEGDAARVATLLTAETTANGLFGEEVASVESQLSGTIRDEAVVAAPGQSSVFVYLCTGLDGDDVGEGIPRCLPEGS